MRASGLLLLIASTSTQGLLSVNGFSPSPLHHQHPSSSAAPISSTTLWVQHYHHTRISPVVTRKTHHHIDHDDDDEQIPFFSSPSPAKPSSSKPSSLPEFSLTKTELRLDGLEPYVVVSAITSTTSFGVVSGSNLFTDAPMFSSTGHMFQDVLRDLLLVSSSASSGLGLYALGIFAFSIMYSKAALARSDSSQELYRNFFNETADLRYKGYKAFVWSLMLLVTDLFMFALSYMPESAQPLVAIGSVPLLLTCWKDWQTIITKASVIYETPEDEESVEIGEVDSAPAVYEAEKERTEQNGWISLTIDKAIGVLTSL